MKNLKLQMFASASIKSVRISPFKVRRILNIINGHSCYNALYVLKRLPYKACPIIYKLVYSAISNFRCYYKFLSLESIFIFEAKANEGPCFKRFCPHAQGKGFPIKKRTSRIVSQL